MTGKLDEISQAIGGLQATTDGLAKQLDVHCVDDRHRHEDNLQTLREINEQIREVNESVRALQPLAETVALMKPIVDGYEISRWKLTGALGLGVAILTVIGWLIEGLIGRAAGWLIDKLH
jgi:hypothetical protein